MTEQQTPERKRTRSPGYPNFALPEAIRKAELIYRHDKRNPVPPAVAAEHWGYSPSSSAVLLSVATLKKFGLLEEVGGGSSRQLKLTDLALHILLGTEGSDDRAVAVRTAALNPQIHAELWEQYGDALPSDTNLKRILIIEKGFNDAAAQDVIREYKETISFAGVKRESKMEEAAINTSNEEAAKMPAMTAQSPAHPAGFGASFVTGTKGYRFPLVDTADAELHLPTPLSEENYELLKEQLESFLRLTKRALVAKDSNRQPGAAAGGD